MSINFSRPPNADPNNKPSPGKTIAIWIAMFLLVFAVAYIVGSSK